MSRLIGYCRVSSSTQCLDIQRDALLKTGVDEHRIFSDKASGKDTNREGLENMLAFLDVGDVIKITKLDRLGRNSRDMLELLELIQSKGASVDFIQEGLSTNGTQGKLIIQILAAVAEAERERINERCESGRVAAKEKGVKFGKKRTIDRQQVVTLKAGGMGATAIAKQLSISRTQVYQILKEEQSPNDRHRQEQRVSAEVPGHDEKNSCTQVCLSDQGSSREDSANQKVA